MNPQEILEKFLVGEIGVGEFQLWIYQNDSLSSFFGESKYGSLLNEVYSEQNATAIRRDLSYEFEQRWPDRLQLLGIRICCTSILGGGDVKRFVRSIANARYALDWIPIGFAGIDSELDAIPGEDVRHVWDEQAWLAMQEPMKDYLPVIEAATRELLVEVESRLRSTLHVAEL